MTEMSGQEDNKEAAGQAVHHGLEAGLGYRRNKQNIFRFSFCVSVTIPWKLIRVTAR